MKLLNCISVFTSRVFPMNLPSSPVCCAPAKTEQKKHKERQQQDRAAISNVLSCQYPELTGQCLLIAPPCEMSRKLSTHDCWGVFACRIASPLNKIPPSLEKLLYAEVLNRRVKRIRMIIWVFNTFARYDTPTMVFEGFKGHVKAKETR